MIRIVLTRLVFLLTLLAAGAAQGALVAEYRMDADSWNGTAGEVVDSSGNGFSGVARQTDTTAALLCRGADLSADSTADYLDLDEDALDGLTNFTLMIWLQTTDDTNFILVSGANAGEDKELFWRGRDGDRLRPEIKDDADGNIDLGTFDDGTWHHFAWTRNGSTNCFYLNGVEEECNSLVTGALDVDPTGFIVGQRQDDIGYDFRSGWDVHGLVDEFYVFDHVMSEAEINQVRQNNQAGLNWDGSARACGGGGPTLAPRAAYFFDEPSWDGTPDEVADSSGNGLHGNAFNADTTDGLVCRAADLSAAGTADYLSIDNEALNGAGDFSISLWINTTNTANQALLSGARAGGLVEANELIFWFWSGTNFTPYFGSNNSSMGVPFLWNGTWRHLVWVRSGASNCLYVDGTLANCRNLTTATRTIDPGGLIIGQEQDAVGGSFIASQSVRGLMDEYMIFRQALTAAQVTSIYTNNLNGLSWDGTARSCPTFGAAEFEISHDGAGIYCAAERIGVRALDAGGATLTSYASTVVLDTGTGNGTWQLAIGGGVLSDPTPDDGLATYTFAAADAGQAWFDLSYSAGTPAMDIEVMEQGNTSIRDNDTEGLLTFSPTGFTVTASALPNPPPGTVNDPLSSRTAGTDFSVHLTAYGTTESDPICGVIEDYAGPRNVEVWQDWVDPGSGSLRATADGTTVGPSEPAAVIVSVNFVAGQAELTGKYKDAGRLRLNFKEGSLTGATDAFVSVPAEMRILSVTDGGGMPNPASASTTGPGFVAAGEPFNLVVDVLDAEGDRTPNFGNEAVPELVEASSAQLVLPAAGQNGSGDDGILGNASAFLATGTPGRFTNSSVYFDEVGVVRLQAGNADYLGAGAVGGALTGNVGRFFPDHFELTSSLLSLDCGAFVYMDAPHITLQADVLARTALFTTTQNYDTGFLGAGAVGQLVAEAEAADDAVDLGARLNFAAADWQLGAYSINDPDAYFARLPTPDGAYETLAVGLKVLDALDGRTLSALDMNASTSGACAPAACSAREIGLVDVYYGRLAVLPAQGSETEPLDIDLEAQVFTNGAFVEHLSDSCSTYQAADVTLGNYRFNLDPGETTVVSPAASAVLDQGHANPTEPLLLSAPGTGNEGVVEVLLNVPAWLRFDWLGTGDTNPSADATFGRFRGHDRIIFWQQDPLP